MQNYINDNNNQQEFKEHQSEIIPICDEVSLTPSKNAAIAGREGSVEKLEKADLGNIQKYSFQLDHITRSVNDLATKDLTIKDYIDSMKFIVDGKIV